MQYFKAFKYIWQYFKVYGGIQNEMPSQKEEFKA